MNKSELFSEIQEEILWEGIPEYQNLKYSGMFMKIYWLVFFILQSIVVLIVFSKPQDVPLKTILETYPTEVGAGIAFYIIIMIGFLAWYAYLRYKDKESIKTYAVTPSRLIFRFGTSNYRYVSLYYENIKDLYRDYPNDKNENIHFICKDSIGFGQMNKRSQVIEPSFEYINEGEQPFKMIKEIWVEKIEKISNRTNKRLQKIADKYQIQYTPYEVTVDSETFPEINGTIGEHEVHVKIKGFKPVESLSIKIRCDNPEGKSLFLSRENGLTKLGSLVGLPDLIIGNDSFDKKYVIQAGDENFAAQVLAAPVQNKLLAPQHIPMETIILGEKEKKELLKLRNKKRSNKDDDNILDYHLLFNEGKNNTKDEQIEEVDEEKASYIRYMINTKKYDNELTFRHLEYMIDSLLELGKAVNLVNKEL